MSSELSQRLARRRCLNGEAEIRMVSLIKEEEMMEGKGRKDEHVFDTEDTGSERENQDSSNQTQLYSKSKEDTISSLPYCQMCSTSIAVQKCMSCETCFCYICGNNHVPNSATGNEESGVQEGYQSPQRISPSPSPKHRYSPLSSTTATTSTLSAPTPIPRAASSSSSSSSTTTYTHESFVEKYNGNLNENSYVKDEKSPQTLSDDISETISVYSDQGPNGGSAGYTGISKNSIHVKKHAQIVQKLKVEIASLQEQLNESTYTDVQTIQTKLRTTMLEMQKIKEHNGEMRDRVQSLEDRLYKTLQREIVLKDELSKEKAKVSSSSPLSSSSSGVKIKTESDNQGDDKLNQLNTNASDGIASIEYLKAEVTTLKNESNGFRSAKDWQRRCLHLERLVSAYEERIKVLEVCWFISN